MRNAQVRVANEIGGVAQDYRRGLQGGGRRDRDEGDTQYIKFSSFVCT
jgi:hypothetical protein